MHRCSVRIFRAGAPEDLLLWHKDFEHVVECMPLETASAKCHMMRQMSDGEARRVFQNKAKEHHQETEENFQKIQQDLIEHFFPPKALQRQKRWLRRVMCKPRDMTIRQLVERVSEINDYLIYFPPFSGELNQPEEDELLEILLCSVPNSWQKELIMQGKDADEMSLHELLEFFDAPKMFF